MKVSCFAGPVSAAAITCTAAATSRQEAQVMGRTPCLPPAATAWEQSVRDYNLRAQCRGDFPSYALRENRMQMIRK